MARAYRHAVADHHPLHRQMIQHAQNEGEYRIPGTRHTVDGYDTETNTVRTCHPDVHLTLLDRTMDDVRDVVDKKRVLLQNLGYHVVEMWESSWNTLKNSNQDLAEFIAHLDLQASNHHYGGQTNAVRVYAPAKDGEKEIRYDDYTSLYPWVNLQGEYAVGHPTFIYQTYTISHPISVQPNAPSFHPRVSTIHICHDKLTFPLCHACIEEIISRALLDKKSACHHTDDQRALTGTWCTPELEAAVQKGYTIMHIHEVWHFAEKCTRLFWSYVDTWLKSKEEASG